MDVFVEQIVKIKNSVARVLLMALIVVVAAAVAVFCFMYSMNPGYNLLLLGTVGALFGAYKLLLMFFVEYEYIITNGTLDIDKIVAKSSRKRIVSFECKQILRAGKYNKAAKPVTDASETMIFCNEDDPNAQYMLIDNNGKKWLIIFAPNDKLKNAIKECVPRTMAKELFAD